MVVKSSFLSVRQKQVFDFIHSRTDVKVFYHSCGSVYDLISEFIEIGVDILNPVQTSAAKMDLEVLKRQFGKDISFWGGGIDVQQKLPYYSLLEIVDEVKHTLDTWRPAEVSCSSRVTTSRPTSRPTASTVCSGRYWTTAHTKPSKGEVLP